MRMKFDSIMIDRIEKLGEQGFTRAEIAREIGITPRQLGDFKYREQMPDFNRKLNAPRSSTKARIDSVAAQISSGRTKQQAAEAIGISVSTVSNIAALHKLGKWAKEQTQATGKLSNIEIRHMLDSGMEVRDVARAAAVSSNAIAIAMFRHDQQLKGLKF